MLCVYEMKIYCECTRLRNSSARCSNVHMDGTVQFKNTMNSLKIHNLSKSILLMPISGPNLNKTEHAAQSYMVEFLSIGLKLQIGTQFGCGRKLDSVGKQATGVKSSISLSSVACTQTHNPRGKIIYWWNEGSMDLVGIQSCVAGGHLTVNTRIIYCFSCLQRNHLLLCCAAVDKYLHKCCTFVHK